MWPDNWRVFTIFESLQTQWRHGFAGPLGLDYAALYPLLDRFTPDRSDWTDAFADVRVLESQALKTMASHRST